MIIQLFFNDLRIPYRSASKIQLKKEEYSQIIQDVIRTFIFLMIPQKAQCYYFDIFCDYFVKQNHRHSLRLQTDQCLLWTRDFILAVPLYIPSDGECNKGLLHCTEVGARSTTRSSIKYQTNSVQSCKFRTSGKGKHVSKISEKKQHCKICRFWFLCV